MKLITKEIQKQLKKNTQKIASGKVSDGELKPVLKLFTPDANATWLFTSLDNNDPDILFGLCDLGMGFPELGYASIAAIERLRGTLGLPVERDQHFTPEKTLSEYAQEATLQGHIQS